MKMIILKVDFMQNLIIVTGITPVGEIKGVWKFDEAPVLGERYFVELDIDQIDGREAFVFYAQMLPLQVYLDDTWVCFLGLCEGVDERDEICEIRFAADWIEMVEISDAFLLKEGAYILFRQRYDLIAIYPYRYE